MDSMTLGEAVNIFKKFDNDLPEEFRISRQDILNGDVRKINKAYRILAMRYHPDRNSSPEAKEKFKEIGSVYKFLGEEAEYYKTKKMSGAEETREKTDEDEIMREAARKTDEARVEREAEETRRKTDEDRLKRELEKVKQEEARRKAEAERIRQETETKETKWKKTYDEQDTFENKIIDLEKQREKGIVQKIMNRLTGKSIQGDTISKAELQKIVKRMQRKKIPKIKDERQRSEYQDKLYLITKIYKLIKGGRFDESKSLECFNRLMDLETSIDNVLMAQEMEVTEQASTVVQPQITPKPKPLQLEPGPKPGEYAPIVKPDYTVISRPKYEGPMTTPPPKKPLQLEPGQETSKPEPKKQKTKRSGIPKNFWIPLLQFFAFLLGIFLLLFTPYWIFGLPLVVAGILLLVGVQSEREGLRELFDWFLHDDAGNKWGMVLVVGIGSLILGFRLGDWTIALIPLGVIISYRLFGKKVVGEGRFMEYVAGLSGATIILYYFFGTYIALIPVVLVLLLKIYGNVYGKKVGEHFIEFIITGTGIVLFIGGTQYAATYLGVTFSAWQLIVFGVLNTIVLIILWSMEESEGNAEKDEAETEEARATAEYYRNLNKKQTTSQDKRLNSWMEGTEKEKLKMEKETEKAKKEAAEAETEAAEAEEEAAEEKKEN